MPDNNALHDAAREGNLADVQAQVNNFDINAKGEENKTALVWAAMKGETEVVKMLLTYKADVNIPDVCTYSSTHTSLVHTQILILPHPLLIHTNNTSFSPLTYLPIPLLCDE